MYVVQVCIKVKPEFIDDFITACISNAQASLGESGIARFDVIQQADDPTRFVLFEVYRQPEDTARHKESAHYKTWREIAEPMMSEPRTRTIYNSVFPLDMDW